MHLDTSASCTLWRCLGHLADAVVPRDQVNSARTSWAADGVFVDPGLRFVCLGTELRCWVFSTAVVCQGSTVSARKSWVIAQPTLCSGEWVVSAPQTGKRGLHKARCCSTALYTGTAQGTGILHCCSSWWVATATQTTESKFAAVAGDQGD